MDFCEKYFHPLYEESYNDFMDAIPFQDEIILSFTQYEGKLRMPDLLGKTVRVSAVQLPDLYAKVEKLSQAAGIAVPDVYVYEDFSYGVEAKGVSAPRIEISAKTIADLSDDELNFLLAREICRIKHSMTKLTLTGEHLLNMLNNTSLVPGSDTLAKAARLKYAKWSRLSHYSADCYGLLATGNIRACVRAILILVLNNKDLAEKININEYIAQASDIYLLDDVISRFSQNDEKIPYGPLRIKNLLAFAVKEL